MSGINLKFSKPVKYSIILLFIVAAVYVLIKSIGIYHNYSWRKEVRIQAETKVNGEVRRIQKIFHSIEQIPIDLAFVLEFSKPEKEHMEVLINAVVENNDEVFGTCVAYEPYAFDKKMTYYDPYIYKKDGKVVHIETNDTTDNYFSADWYLLSKKLNKSVWIEPYFDEGTAGGNIVMATYSIPFYSYDGVKETMTGIIAIDISLDWLKKIVSSIKLSDGSYTVLVSENGTIISAPRSEWIYNETLFSLAEEGNIPILREIGRDLQRGNSGFVNIGKIGTLKNWWVYYKPIPANNWSVLLVVPEE
jgi:sigma-B regulation protein RsbU (phosphoserine phosphatase)